MSIARMPVRFSLTVATGMRAFVPNFQVSRPDTAPPLAPTLRPPPREMVELIKGCPQNFFAASSLREWLS
jgi:hypothetical protein